jgi:hypothetical protein
MEEDERPPILQYWARPPTPDYIDRMIATFTEQTPELVHIISTWAGAEELIKREFGRRELDAFAACAVPAMQADYFRYCAVYADGGLWADADLRCVADIKPLLEGSPRGILFGRPELPPRWQTPEFEWRERVGPYRAIMNSVFAFPDPGHPLLELAIEIATVNIEWRIAEDVALVTGPAIFTSLYLLRELGSFDAYHDYVQGGALEPGAPLLCETIGDFARVVRALDGVRLPPVEEAANWFAEAEEPLPYKETADHWLNVSGSIFR